MSKVLEMDNPPVADQAKVHFWRISYDECHEEWLWDGEVSPKYPHVI